MDFTGIEVSIILLTEIWLNASYLEAYFEKAFAILSLKLDNKFIWKQVSAIIIIIIIIILLTEIWLFKIPVSISQEGIHGTVFESM